MAILATALAVVMTLPPPASGQSPKTPQQVFKESAPAVVVILLIGEANKVLSIGTGFVVSADGVIVTNHHVISPPQPCRILVKCSDGDVYDDVAVVYDDERRDFAVLAVKAPSLPVLRLGDSDRVDVGDTVLALGTPKGLELTFTQGIISAVRPDPEKGYKFIQHQAPISPGSSGGPLFNARGEVIGINTFAFKDGQNLNGAVPINYVKPYLKDPPAMSFAQYVASRAGAAAPAAARGAPPLLRTQPRRLSMDDVAAMVKQKGLYDYRRNKIDVKRHDLELQVIGNDEVVLDRTTGLMWHRSGSGDGIAFPDAVRWLGELNARGYAGCSDWRLPTTEEAASLMEPREDGELFFVSGKFSYSQNKIWTCDDMGDGSDRWLSDIAFGSLNWTSVKYEPFEISVRPVRSGPLPGRKTFKRGAFRSSADRLSRRELAEALAGSGLFERNFNPGGGFGNDFEARQIGGDSVVVDRAAGLMWHASGSPGDLTHEGARQWIEALNRAGYAGFRDWAMPSVEEAASLLEPEVPEGAFHTDPLFATSPEYGWTIDQLTDIASEDWCCIHFKYGMIITGAGKAGVRPVRANR